LRKDVYKRNLDALAKRTPHIADAVDSADTRGVALERSKSGEWTIKFGERHLVSRYDPIREVEKRASDFWREPPDLAAFFGFGMGYQLDFVPRNFDGHIVIYEPVPGVLKLAFSVRDFTKVLENPKATVALDVSDLNFDASRMFGFKVNTKIALFDLLTYRSLFADELARLTYKLEGLEADKDLNQQTVYTKSKLWSENIFRNLPELLSRPGVELLRDRFRGLPCVVVASGPSLDESLPYLQRLKGRAVLIACGSATRSLIDAGANPELSVAIESNDITYQFDGLDLTRTYLALLSRVHPALWRLEPRGFFGFAPAERMDASILNMFGRASILDVGGSVSTAAFEIGRSMGANPIILVGLDLAFDTSGRSHATGCGTGKEDFYGELKPERADHLKRYGIFFVEGCDGGRVATRLAWMDYLLWFERRIGALRKRGVTVINASERGARISGAERMSLKEVLNSLDRKFDPLSVLDRLAADSPCPATEAGWDRLKKRLAELDRLGRLAEKLQDRYATASEVFARCGDLPTEREERRFRRLEAEVKRVAGELDPLLSPLIQRELFVFYNCFEDALETGNRKAVLHLFSRAQLLYGGICKAARTTFEWIGSAHRRWMEMRRKFDEERCSPGGEEAHESLTVAENI